VGDPTKMLRIVVRIRMATPHGVVSSFPRRRESSSEFVACGIFYWIPAYAGMTTTFFKLGWSQCPAAIFGTNGGTLGGGRR
jgi:hypothetical protein